MSAFEKSIILTVFCLMLIAPGLLFVAGVGGGALENEQLDPPPDLAVSRLLDPVMFGEISSWYSDRVPIRAPAVKADAWADRYVFSDSPSPKVILGEEGWLFYSTTILNPCKASSDAALIAATLNEADRLLTQLDRSFLVVIGPDKASVYPEMVSESALRLCDREESRRLQDLIESDVPSAIDTWEVLGSNRDALGQPVYEPGETHWTSAGAVLVTEAVIEAIDPTLWDDRFVVNDESVEQPIGDLDLLIGLPAPALAQSYGIERPGVTEEKGPSGDRIEATSVTASGAAMVELPTIFVHDSFGARLFGRLTPFFASSTWTTWHAFEVDEESADQLAAAMLGHDRIVIEMAEREIYRQVPGVFREALLHVIERELARLPSRSVDPAALFGSSADEPVSIRSSEPASFSLEPGEGLRYLVLDVSESGTPSLGVDDGEFHAPSNGRIALRLGPTSEFDLHVRGGQVQIESAWIVEIP